VASQISLSQPQEKRTGAITVAVTGFLADLRLSGSERVLGALALALAEGMDESPAYAKGKLARELREVLAELTKAELAPSNLDLLEALSCERHRRRAPEEGARLASGRGLAPAARDGRCA
jgi:hypothetical protein